jgi:SRSO17 transposase
VKTHDIPAVAAAPSVDGVDLASLDRWQREFDEVVLRIGPRFARVEPRRRVAAFLAGLLAELPRRNCWTIAEHAGDLDPRGMQRLLSQAVWDEDGVRDDLRNYVAEQLGEPGAVLVVDETGDVKKGTCTVGVHRQYTGTAGRIENSQVAVYLTYAAVRGYAFIDRELYLPQSWAADTDRRAGAGVPEDVAFATKPALARAMIDRAVDAGIPARWAAGDEVYGADPALRKALAGHGLGFVLAVAKSHRFTTGIGTRRAIDLAVRLPASAWQRISAGDGAKGPRWYDWALIEVTDPALTSNGSDGSSDPAQGANWLLIRRRISDGEYAFYRAPAPRTVPVADLVRVAGVRWTIEESFAGGKELAALDEHQVRTWRSWRRWTVLAMLAHAFLSGLTAAAAPPGATRLDCHDHADRDLTSQLALIPLTRNEIRRLFTVTVTILRTLQQRLHWSQWRRHHQAVARACHHHRRAEQQV